VIVGLEGVPETTLASASGGRLLVDESPCGAATLAATKRIEVAGTGSGESVVVDAGRGTFGRTAIALQLGAGEERSWRAGCPVGLADLRLVEVRRWTFHRDVREGKLVVNEDAVDDMTGALRRVFEHRFPIRRMRLLDAYGASDRRSMRADNTSAFNCRFIAGRPGVWSQHAFGRAIDLNPVENPYVSGDHISPPAGRRFANRSRDRKGMIGGRGPVVRAFRAAGWEWGGRWDGARDYQHFSANGR
jgi:poly-gamma-glutamate synthesis protein (capsule biosynthesis protein)